MEGRNGCVGVWVWGGVWGGGPSSPSTIAAGLLALSRRRLRPRRRRPHLAQPVNQPKSRNTSSYWVRARLTARAMAALAALESGAAATRRQKLTMPTRVTTVSNRCLTMALLRVHTLHRRDGCTRQTWPRGFCNRRMRPWRGTSRHPGRKSAICSSCASVCFFVYLQAAQNQCPRCQSGQTTLTNDNSHRQTNTHPAQLTRAQLELAQR